MKTKTALVLRAATAAVAGMIGACASGGCSSDAEEATLPRRLNGALAYLEVREQRAPKTVPAADRKFSNVDYKSTLVVNPAVGLLERAAAGGAAAGIDDLSNDDLARLQEVLDLVTAGREFTEQSRKSADRLSRNGATLADLRDKIAADQKFYDTLVVAVRRQMKSAAGAAAYLDAIASPINGRADLRQLDTRVVAQLIADESEAGAQITARANSSGTLNVQFMVEAWLLQNGKRTRIHVQDYDDLPPGETEKTDRFHGVTTTVTAAKGGNSQKAMDNVDKALGASGTPATPAGVPVAPDAANGGAAPPPQPPTSRGRTDDESRTLLHGLVDRAEAGVNSQDVIAAIPQLNIPDADKATLAELNRQADRRQPVLVLSDAAAALLLEQPGPDPQKETMKKMSSKVSAHTAQSALADIGPATDQAAAKVQAANEHDTPRGLENIVPGFIDLADTPADRGDAIEVLSTLSLVPPPAGSESQSSSSGGAAKGKVDARPAQSSVLDSEKVNFDVGRFGIVGDFSAGLIFANRFNAGKDKDTADFQPAAAASYIWHYRQREWDPAAQDVFSTLNRFFDPGFGIHVAVLPFDNDTKVGVGIVGTVFNDVLQFGYGYALTGDDDPQYWYVGIGILEALGTVGDLAVHRSDLVKSGKK